jgi:hypothetical protein
VGIPLRLHPLPKPLSHSGRGASEHVSSSPRVGVGDVLRGGSFSYHVRLITYETQRRRGAERQRGREDNRTICVHLCASVVEVIIRISYQPPQIACTSPLPRLNAPTLPRSHVLTFQRPNASTLPRSNASTFHRSNASTFHRSNASTFHRFNASTFHRFNAPTLPRSNAPTSQRFNAPTLQRFNASTLQRFNASSFFWYNAENNQR